MERKDKLKKLNELKRSIIAMSLATTVVLGVSGCSNEDEPYFSEELSIEDYFESHDEDNCYAVSYIDNTKFDGRTFEEWNNVYKEARSNSIYDGDTNTYKPSSENSEIIMNRALYSMGILVLKGQVIESLNIAPENITEIKIVAASKDNNDLVRVSYKTYEVKKATGNIDTNVVSYKDESYDLKGKAGNLLRIIVSAGDQKLSSSHDLADYDEAYQKISEFMLCKGTPSDGLLSGKTIDFSLDPVKVIKFNEKHDPEHQTTMVKTTETVK